MDEFLGHPISYWIEIEKETQKLGYSKLIQEIGNLRGKVSFYESRIEEMNNFMNIK